MGWIGGGNDAARPTAQPVEGDQVVADRTSHVPTPITVSPPFSTDHKKPQRRRQNMCTMAEQV